jgi:hypothetical protein
VLKVFVPTVRSSSDELTVKSGTSAASRSRYSELDLPSFSCSVKILTHMKEKVWVKVKGQGNEKVEGNTLTTRFFSSFFSLVALLSKCSSVSASVLQVLLLVFSFSISYTKNVCMNLFLNTHV